MRFLNGELSSTSGDWNAYGLFHDEMEAISNYARIIGQAPYYDDTGFLFEETN